MNSMTHKHDTDSASVSQDTPELKVEARRLDVEVGTLTIAWEDTEVEPILRAGRERHPGIYMPSHAGAGYVVIGLDTDGEYGSTEVATQMARPSYDRDVPRLLERAADQLRLLASGIRQAQAGTEAAS